MSLTNFPNGITSYGVPVFGGSAQIPTTTGKYFFVSSTTGSNGNSGTDVNHPVATIDHAIGLCTANKGDVIVIMPGHTETLTAAGQLVFDIAGVTVVGLGTGSLMPKILHSSNVADVDIDAANVTIRNIKFIASAADVIASIDLNAANLWLDGCVWEDEGANLNYIDYITIGAAVTADGLKITGCTAIGADAANDGFLNCNADVNRLIFVGNYIKLKAASTEPVIEVTGQSLTDCLITNNYIERLNTSGIVFVDSDQADNSGIVAYNVIKSADSAAATPFDITGAGLFENYQVGVNDASGLLLPAVDDNA